MLKFKHKMFKKSWQLNILLSAIIALTFLLVLPAKTFAIPVTCPDGSTQDAASADAADHACDNHQVNSAAAGSQPDRQSTTASPISNNIIVTRYIVPIVKFLSIGFGLIVTIMIVVGGIQYSAAGDNPQAVEAAKKRIRNAIFALILFILMGAILQFLVPGGIFQ